MAKEIKWKEPFDKESVKELKKAVKNLGWEDAVQELWDGSTAMIDCEIAYRAKKRAEKLELKSTAKSKDRLEKLHHNRSMGHIKNAMNLFKEANKKLDAKTKKDLDDLAKNPEKFKPSRKEAFEILKNEIIENDMDPEKAVEVVDAYNEQFDMAETKGFSGITDNIDKKLKELIDKRSDLERNRGRDEHHSPLEWWKWLIIIIIVCVSVGALIACLWWSGCSWIWNLIQPIINLIIDIIRYGC